MKGIAHLYCLVLEVDSVYSKPNTDEYDDSALSHLDSLQGRNYVGECDAEYTSVWNSDFPARPMSRKPA